MVSLMPVSIEMGGVVVQLAATVGDRVLMKDPKIADRTVLFSSTNVCYR